MKKFFLAAVFVSLSMAGFSSSKNAGKIKREYLKIKVNGCGKSMTIFFADDAGWTVAQILAVCQSVGEEMCHIRDCAP